MPKAAVRQGLDREKLRQDARRAAYMQQAAERAAVARSRRREALKSALPSLRAACQEMEKLAVACDEPRLVLRTAFIRLEDRHAIPADAWSGGDHGPPTARLEDRPPATRLVHRRTRALLTYLTALAEAQLTTAPGRRPATARALTARRDGWSTLTGDRESSARNRRARISRALAELHTHGLVQLPDSQANRRFDRFKLFDESGNGDPYVVPGPSDAITLPITFITNGWHLVLTNAEIATLLMLTELVARFPTVHRREGVGAVDGVRRSLYGLTPEVYESHRELTEFGLAGVIDSVSARRMGRVPAGAVKGGEPADLVTYRFQLNATAFDRVAADVVLAALTSAVPPSYGNT